MADNTQKLTWTAATQILDANFHFRSPSQVVGGRRSYRHQPNGPALDIWEENGLVLVELPIKVTSLEGNSAKAESDKSRFRYSLADQNSLLECIKALNGRAIGQTPSQKIVQLDNTGNSSEMQTALNIILYGPPGTGKTYKTSQLAVEICDGSASLGREELMARYEELRKEERISFVTFHQSYGYEDFVEGLRPELEANGVNYRVRPGIFREVCDAARRRTLVQPGLNGKSLKERIIYKMSLGVAGTTEGKLAFQDSIEHGVILLGYGDDVDFSETNNLNEIKKKVDETGGFDKPESQARYVNVFKHDIQVGDIIVVSQGNTAFRAIGEVTGPYEFLEVPYAGRFHQSRRVRWLAVFEGNRSVEEIYNKNFMQSTLYKLDPEFINFTAFESLIAKEMEAGKMNFVLIIDEINRANISKVFGELITLLEQDKREGEINALTVKLPYSGNEFNVPPNLYIIGTMNTADRSIALLDTALRRRFEFEELQPDYAALPEEAIEGINIRAMLKALNDRIEYLYDRDHTIGHAYFINVSSIAGLDKVFRRKVIPLLQEYFYENWSKVQAVLNDKEHHFIEVKNDLPKGLESIVDGYDSKPRYRVRNEPFPPAAFLNIYQ
jgi:5-methylcytosine-specific restriction protein B